ncbi:MAG: hypothetical protein GC182_05270 [Rhodopseudomonas sp.]|nr:hypothetical protein [Rhodopseudomonas sp.]
MVERLKAAMGRTKMRILPVVVLVSLTIGVPAKAEDLKVLTRILYAADLADQANTYCILADPSFTDNARGRLGNMRQYAEHIKREVTSDLRQADALEVMLAAAGTAKDEMIAVLSDIRGKRDGNVPKLISAWCRDKAKTLITEVIATHDDHHAEIDGIMARAKSR